MRLSRFASIATAAALLGLGAVGCGSQAGTTAGNPAPRKLSLASTAAPGPSPSTSSAPAVPLPAPPAVPGWAQVKLSGKLPASGPASGAVRNLPGGAVPQATVRALATALHLTGAPQRVPGGWRVTGGGTLQVADGAGQHWVFVATPVFLRCLGPVIRASKSPPVAGGGGAAGAVGAVAGKSSASLPSARARACPVKPGQLEPAGPLPVPSTGAPTGQAAQAAAAPVLQAAGLAGAPLRITVIGSYAFVSADPVVDGLPTSGFSTTVGVGPGNRVTQANGWLSRPAAGTVYPLIGAKEAFSELKASTHPARGGHPPEVMCPLNPDVLCGTVGPIREIQVTGAVYGLSLSYNRGEPVLVPSWLFSVAGSSLRIPEVAIDPHYLSG
ncbi:MAG: hypothetical protein ACM3ML_30670 [Micromonosporaceae bacterium]